MSARASWNDGQHRMAQYLRGLSQGEFRALMRRLKEKDSTAHTSDFVPSSGLHLGEFALLHYFNVFVHDRDR